MKGLGQKVPVILNVLPVEFLGFFLEPSRIILPKKSWEEIKTEVWVSEDTLPPLWALAASSIMGPCPTISEDVRRGL